MKKILIIYCALQLGVSLGFTAEEAPLVFENQPLPPGPLLAKAADFSKWQIDFIFAAQPAPPASALLGQAAMPVPELPKQVSVTRTKPRWHAQLLTSDNKKRELWFDGNIKFEVTPEADVVPIAAFNPGYSAEFLDCSTTDFPDMDWISPKNYLGIQKGTNFRVFKQEGTGTMVWIDASTRLPSRWVRGGEMRVFKFLPPPTAALVLPGNVGKVSEDFQKLQRLSNQVPIQR